MNFNVQHNIHFTRDGNEYKIIKLTKCRKTSYPKTTTIKSYTMQHDLPQCHLHDSVSFHVPIVASRLNP